MFSQHTHTHYMHKHCTYILWTHTHARILCKHKHTAHTCTPTHIMCIHTHYAHTNTHCAHILVCIHYTHTHAHTAPMWGLLCHGSKNCFSETACTLHANAAVRRMSAFSPWVPLSECSSVPSGAQEAPVPVHRKWAGTTLIICLLEAENCFLHCSGSWHSGCLHGNSPGDSWWSVFTGLSPSQLCSSWLAKSTTDLVWQIPRLCY